MRVRAMGEVSWVVIELDAESVKEGMTHKWVLQNADEETITHGYATALEAALLDMSKALASYAGDQVCPDYDDVAG